MSALTLRQQLAQISEIQAALDALKVSIHLQLREAQLCTDAQAIAATEVAGISPSSGSS